MCGLFGWDWNTKSICREQRTIIATVLTMENEDRGDDSWGVYYVRSDKLIKDKGPITQSGIVREIVGSPTLIGHTRKATTGTISVENAHPFRFATMVGAHNGIVGNHETLNKRYGRQCTVDSQHIFHHLEDGLDTSDITAYGAITYTHIGSPRVNLCWFNNGDLSVYHLPKVGLVWSSMGTPIKKAMHMAGVRDAVPYEMKEDHLYYTEGGVLYQTKRTLEFQSYFSGVAGSGYLYASDNMGMGKSWRSSDTTAWPEKKTETPPSLKSAWHKLCYCHAEVPDDCACGIADIDTIIEWHNNHA